MPEYNIKISELDPLPLVPKTEDFFPLVDSSSMTTYRATIQDIGLLITHSIYADTASYLLNYKPTISASWASASISASYALTASYAISASHANLSDSSSYYPPQILAISCSWASASISASWAERALDVDTHGPMYNFPYWTSDTPHAGNGNLLRNSPLYYFQDPGYGYTLIFDSASTILTSAYPYPIHRPDFQRWRYGDRANNAWGFTGNSGIQSFWPITSQTFVGTDQRDWYFVTSSTPHAGWDPQLQITNSYFSGSAGDASSGSFYTIPCVPGALASIFNGKWLRISAQSIPFNYDNDLVVGPLIPPHAPMGEMDVSQDQIMKGLISLRLDTTVFPGGSNTSHQVDFYIHASAYVGGINATVLHVNTRGKQLIRAIRLHSYTPQSIDPTICLDILVDGLYSGGEQPGYLGEPSLTITAQSWQGIRFLKWINVDPWLFQDTGSNDLQTDQSQLIFPTAPGFYSNVSKNMNYNIHGQNVVIWPTPNNITQSGAAISALASKQSLFVSGSIETNEAYYCNNSKGWTGTVPVGRSLQISGGILIGYI